jgi:peptidyl-prolyl cis-trans isomerase B (cyclophilin B)
MKHRFFALLMFGLFAATVSSGCQDNVGGTISAITSGSATGGEPISGNFAAADPAAKAAVDAKAKAEADKAAMTSSGQSTTGAPAGKSGLDDTAAPGATAPKDGEEVAVLETNLGKIVLKFFPDKAPNHVKNFKKLANDKFYDTTKFHRVIPGFMIQGGDPNTKPGASGAPGTGGPGYTVKAEFNDTHHGRGILSMARSADPDSAGSQFFICVADANSLDNQYTAFGIVVKGMDVVDKIVNLPRDAQDNPTPDPAIMNKVTIQKWPVK